MLMHGDPGAGGLRGALLARALIALAAAGVWLIPGLAWRGLAAMERPAVLGAQADTVRGDSARAPAAPTVPGAAIQAPAPSSGSAPVTLATRLSGLVGLALIVGLGILLSH